MDTLLILSSLWQSWAYMNSILQKGGYFYKENFILLVISFFGYFCVLTLPSLHELKSLVQKITTLNGAYSFYCKFFRSDERPKYKRAVVQQGFRYSGPMRLFHAWISSQQLCSPNRASNDQAQAEICCICFCPGAILILKLFCSLI